MSKKLTYEHVKSEIESFKTYQLLSTEYINCSSKLKIECPEGHIFEMSWDNFKAGHRCPKCAVKIQAKNQSYNLKYVKSYIESNNGYKLISEKYKNSLIKLKIQCPLGHIFDMSFHHFKIGQRCSVCARKIQAKKKTLKYSDVKSYIEKFNYKLLSTEYINAKTKLKIQCDKGHIYWGTFANFKNHDCRCPQCSQSKMFYIPERKIQKYVLKNYNNNIISNNNKKTILNSKTGCYLELDIYLPEIKKAIEFNGKYWHSKPDTIIRDQIKKEQCKKLGIDLLIIEEKDWIINEKSCLDKIDHFLKI